MPNYIGYSRRYGYDVYIMDAPDGLTTTEYCGEQLQLEVLSQQRYRPRPADMVVSWDTFLYLAHPTMPLSRRQQQQRVEHLQRQQRAEEDMRRVERTRVYNETVRENPAVQNNRPLSPEDALVGTRHQAPRLTTRDMEEYHWLGGHPAQVYYREAPGINPITVRLGGVSVVNGTAYTNGGYIVGADAYETPPAAPVAEQDSEPACEPIYRTPSQEELAAYAQRVEQLLQKTTIEEAETPSISFGRATARIVGGMPQSAREYLDAYIRQGARIQGEDTALEWFLESMSQDSVPTPQEIADWQASSPF